MLATYTYSNIAYKTKNQLLLDIENTYLGNNLNSITYKMFSLDLDYYK